jgi:hypothetical protein
MNLNSDGKITKHLIHLDEKILKPNDTATSGLVSTEANNNTLSSGLRPDGLQKSVIGKPKVYDLKGNLLAEEENLVVLTGREFLAQLIAFRSVSDDQGSVILDLTNYKVTHFGVGKWGTTETCPPVANGPYDDDIDISRQIYDPGSTPITPCDVYLGRPIIKDPTAGGTEADYIDDGKLKRIELDGEIKIIQEEHTINTCSGGQDTIDKYTAIRYTMYLQPDEPQDKPFKFNEAGLFAVEHDPNTGLPVVNPDGSHNYILFARFTTLDKWLESADGIMIEWYILV